MQFLSAQDSHQTTHGCPGFVCNARAAALARPQTVKPVAVGLKKRTGGLTLQAGRERLAFRSWGLYRDSVRERCRLPGLWRFLFYIAPPGSGYSTTLTVSMRFRQSATRAFAKVSASAPVEIGCGSFDIEFERGRDAGPEDRRRRTAICHDRSLLAFQRRPLAGETHVRAPPRNFSFWV